MSHIPVILSWSLNLISICLMFGFCGWLSFFDSSPLVTPSHKFFTFVETKVYDQKTGQEWGWALRWWDHLKRMGFSSRKTIHFLPYISREERRLGWIPPACTTLHKGESEAKARKKCHENSCNFECGISLVGQLLGSYRSSLSFSVPRTPTKLFWSICCLISVLW